MKYVISYVSKVIATIPEGEINSILEKAIHYNNSNGISGILIYCEGNFFQLLEGEKEKVIELYSQIQDDPRHSEIITIVEKPVKARDGSTGYYCELITDSSKCNSIQIEKYLSYTHILDVKSRNAVKRVFDAMIII